MRAGSSGAADDVRLVLGVRAFDDHFVLLVQKAWGLEGALSSKPNQWQAMKGQSGENPLTYAPPHHPPFTSSAGAERCVGAGQRAQPVGGDGAAAAPGPGRVRPRHGQHPEASARGAAAQGAAERGRPQDALRRVRPRQIRRPEHGGVPACDARVWRAALQWRGAAHLHALRQRQVRQVPPYGFAPPHTGRC